jgi:hypothetical protein
MKVDLVSPIIALLVLYLSLSPLAAEAENAKVGDVPESIRDFVAMAPAALFYTEDELSEEAKAALVKGGFKRTRSFNCSKWGVASESRERLVLQSCADSWVVVQLYRYSNPHKDKRVIVAINSVRSSGRAGDLELFIVTGRGDSFKPLSQQQRSEIGIDVLTEDDFVAVEERFPAGDAQPVSLTLAESGALIGELQTWMDPRWESRNQAFEISFVWRGQRFERVKKRVGGS